MKEQEEETSVVQMPDSIAYNSEKAQVDSQIATAKMYPRNMPKVIKDAIAVVTMDKETAESCTYSVPRGGKTIVGPSVHLARIIAQLWGNLRVESKVVAIEARQIKTEAVCYDLETNYAVKAPWSQSIINKYGERYNDDLIAVTGNAASSKAFRNAVFAVIPKAVVDKIHKEAKQFCLGDVSDEQKLAAKRKKVVDALRGTYNVTEKEILTYVGKSAIDHIDAEDLVTLIGVGTSIKDGDTTVDKAFRPEKETKKDSPLAAEKPDNINVKEPKDKTKAEGKDGKLEL